MIGGAVSASAAAITYVNDLSAGAQAQLNTLRDGSATAKYALVATSAKSASDAVMLGGLSATWYAKTTVSNTFDGSQYQKFTHPHTIFHWMEASGAASGERGWIVNYASSDGRLRWMIADNSGTGVQTLAMFTRVGTAAENAYFYGSGSIYWNGNDLSNPTQMNSVAAAGWARLNAAQTFTGGMGSIPVAVGYSSSITLNMEDGNAHRVVLTGGTTLNAPDNARPGQVLVLIVVQGGSGSYTVTWNSVFRFAGGTPPVLTTTVGGTDVFSFIYDNATGYWLQSGLDVKR